MKKLYTLLFTTSFFVVCAQVPNGDLELWSNPTTLENFTPVTSGTFSANNFVSQESTIKHGGNFSAKHISQETTQAFEAALIPVTVGQTYTMSYWYYDNDATARSRNWSTWVNVVGSTVTAVNTDDLVLHDTPYTADSPNWVLKTVTVTAPAGVTHFKFQIRTYRQATGVSGGPIYYDDLTFTSALATKQNSISGLKVYQNNNNLHVTSDSNEAKSVLVYNILGKNVIKTTITNQVINVADLSSGIYIVKVTENGKTNTVKVILQ
jgi:Secretion system C-terminal sorting domain